MNPMSGESPKARLVAVFLQELAERTRAIEKSLLALEKLGESADQTAHLREVLRSVHSLKGAAGLVEAREIESICHWIEELLTKAGDGTPSSQAMDLLLRSSDAIAEAGRALAVGEEPDRANLEQLAGKAARMAAGEASAPGGGSSRPHRRPQERPDRPADIEAAAVVHPSGRDDGGSCAAAGEAADLAVRVNASRLDILLAQAGDLLLMRTRLAGLAEELRQLHRQARAGRPDAARAGAHPFRRGGGSALEARGVAVVTGEDDPFPSDLQRRLQALAQAADEESRSLQRSAVIVDAEVRRARLQPFSGATEGLDRLVRDVAAAGGKRIALRIEGGGVELDRALLQQLEDVLRHLVRNAADHGIELPEERVRAGKDAEGEIVVSARIGDGRIKIEVSDDGRGFRLDALRRQAGAAGFAADGDEDAARLALLPGVSTITKATRVSGRGVGLDAVRSSVEGLRGAVEVRQAEGQGASLILTLPLTVGRMRAVLVGSGGEIFAVDAASVRKISRFGADDLTTLGERRFLRSPDRPIPLLPLVDWLGLSYAGGATESRLAVELNEIGMFSALEVEEVLGEEEFIIHNLGPRLAGAREFTGGILLPDGRLSLVLNAAMAGAAAAEGVAQGERTPPPSRARRILVADDSLTTRTLEKTILESAGYAVTVAADGDEAWKRLEQEGADLIVADVDMPGLDGFALTDRIRHSARFRDLPVVLLTARETTEDRRRGLEAGADAYLIKRAFDQRELLQTIGQLL